MHPLNPLLVALRRRALSLLVALLLPAAAFGIDIDIFGDINNPAVVPNVLFVLDNTANWSRQSQHFPGGITQGQAEVRAIKTVINGLGPEVGLNVGLLEFPTNGTANDNGGYVRFAVSSVGAGQANGLANRADFSGKLDTIFNNINAPVEKLNQGTAYGNLMYEAYNYFAGVTPFTRSAAVPPGLADHKGYKPPVDPVFSPFQAPASLNESCGTNYLIFIGNPNASGPTKDKQGNTDLNLQALASLGGNTNQLNLPNYTTVNQTLHDNLGFSPGCYPNPPSGTPVDVFCDSNLYTGCSYGSDTTGAALPSGCPTSPTVTSPYVWRESHTSSPIQTSNDVIMVGIVPSCSKNQPNPPPAPCPAQSVVQTAGPGPQDTTTTTITHSCNWSKTVAGAGGSCGGGGKVTWLPVDTQTTAITTTTTISTRAIGCFSNSGECSGLGFTCGAGNTCACVQQGSGSACELGDHYQVRGDYTQITTTPTGTSSLDTNTFNADEWSRFLYQQGVPVSGSDPPAYRSITTYTIDVYGVQPNPGQSGLLASMAENGGGRYFNASNEQAIVDALKTILSEILAVNSTFASASLPISATNRAENDNQVYIGMFRPDSEGHLRWYGNVKRYQIKLFESGAIDLADFNGARVVNNTTGFVTPCAVSWWTSDAGNYWAAVADNGTVSSSVEFTTATDPGKAWTKYGDEIDLLNELNEQMEGGGTCPGTNVYSDYPDGPSVEKGSVAQRLRLAGSGKRNMYTGDMKDFTAANFVASGDGTVNGNIVDFLRGLDVTKEFDGTPPTDIRPSVHGDVVHSRPLPVDYGGETGVRVFYGANDGTYRAVDADTGDELWSYVAQEFRASAQKLLDNPVSSKEFYFDGNTGLYVGKDNNPVVIYPTLRRGGRTVYAFDVTTPESPGFKWKLGCPNLFNDDGCSSGLADIGQTWSLPAPAFVKGYSESKPVVVMGGGYDTCEDSDTASPSCGSAKGNEVYVLDGDSGSILRTFATDRSVVADPAFVDINLDGQVDAAYLADTGGGLYRLDFTNAAYQSLGKDEWTFTKVAFTTGGGRKFLFAPTLLPALDKATGKFLVYVAIVSGDREHPTYRNYPFTAEIKNRFYVYLDDRARNEATNLDGSHMADYSAPTGCDSTNLLGNTQKDGVALYGWFMDLTANGKGEQGVTSPLTIGGLVTFSTNQAVEPDGAVCSSLGNARGYWVNLFNGSGAIGVSGVCGGDRLASFVGGGLPPSPTLTPVKATDDNKTVDVIIGAVKKDGCGNGCSPIGGQEAPLTIPPNRYLRYWRHSGDTR
jgi:Tfp pilus tip-associated adhesin PilY1